MKNQILWIFWLILYILIFVAYDRDPLKYSNKKKFNLISVSNFAKLNTYISLILVTLYGIYLSINHPFVPYLRKYWNYSTFLIGLFVISSLNKKPIEDPSKFYLPPNNLNKNLKIYYLLILIIVIGLRFVTPSNYLIILAIIYLYNYIICFDYATCKYNLPKTFI
jgi:hypothetical protein